MRNSEIHDLFSQGEVRDFLAIAIIKSYEAEALGKLEYPTYRENDDVFERGIEMAKIDIKNIERRIENMRMKQGIFQLIKSKGWEEHDVSDDTQNNTGNSLAMNFIGTTEEYNELMQRINKDK